MLFRHGFVPAMIGFSIASWVFRPEGERALALLTTRIDFATVVLLFAIFLVWLAEVSRPLNVDWNYHLFPDLDRDWAGWGRLGRDLIYLFFISQLSALFINLLSTQLEPLIKGLGVPPLWPSAWPFAVKVLIAFFLIELSSYWFHRVAHRVPFFWRFHSTHHLATEVTALKSLKMHPVDNVFFYVARAIPLLLLGVGPAEVTTVISVGAFLGILAHANIDVAEGPLRWFVNLPRYHVVHHSADFAESRANFGCHTIFWDRVFGTFRPAAQQPLQIGVKPLGMRSLWKELVEPIYRAP